MRKTSRTALRIVALPAVTATVLTVGPGLTGIANAVPPTGSFLNPSAAASGPGNIISDTPDGTNSTYQFVVRANDPDVGGSIASVQIQTEDCDADANFETIGTATRVDSTDTFVYNWDVSAYTPQSDVTNCATGKVQAFVTDSNGETNIIGPINVVFADSSAQTVSITSPAQGGNFGFFTTTTPAQTSGLVSGTASAGTTRVDVFYSTSPAGTAPNWTNCGNDQALTTNTDGTKSFQANCTLTGGDTAADVTAIAAIPNQGVNGSGDAVRVTGYAQNLQSFTISPPSDTQTVGFCNTYSVQLRDQNGAAITTAPVVVEVTGTATGANADNEDIIKFAQNNGVEGTASDPFTPAPAAGGSTTEATNQCDSSGEPDGAPDDVDGTAGPNERVNTAASAPDTKAISGFTNKNGDFRFSLSLPNTTAGNNAAGTYNITAYLDMNANGIQDPAGGGNPAEPGSTATKVYQAVSVNTLDATPHEATNVVGETHTIKATLTDQNGNPISGRTVTFRVTDGPNSNNNLDNNNTTPTGVIGQCNTGANGTCSQSYTSQVTGTDTITVFLDQNSDFISDNGEKSITVIKHWVSTSNATCIDVEPNDALNPTTAAHTITAHVTDGQMGTNGDQPGTFDCTGNLLANVPVDFTVNAGGPNSTLSPDNTGDAQHERVFTDANGVATVTLHDESSTTEGTNFVTASIPGSGFSTITPNLVDISSTGTEVTSIEGCDDCESNQILLPFGFTYAGQTFTNVYVSSNGFIRFSTPDGSGWEYPGQPFPSVSGPNGGVVGGYWEDLDPQSGDVFYQTIGTAPNRTFVIQFKNVPYCCGATPDTNFEFKLFEGSNNVEVHYGNFDLGNANGEEASAGVENLDGTAGTQYFDTADSTTLDPSNTAVRYTPAAETGRQSETVTKSWAIAGKATDLSCTPTIARNLQGQQHTVTCTLTDAFGDGVSGKSIAVRVVSGPNSGNDLDSNPATTPGFITEGTTNANGVITATYTGIANPSTTPDKILAWVDDNQNGGLTNGPDAGDSSNGNTALQSQVEKYWTIQSNLTNAKIAIDMEPTTGTNSTPVGTTNTAKCDADLTSGFGVTDANGGDWDTEATDQVDRVEAVCVSVKGVDGNIQKGLNVTLTSSGTGTLTNNDGTAAGQSSQTNAIQDDGYAIFYITSSTTGDQTLTATAQNVTGSVTGTKHWASFPARNITLVNIDGDTATPGTRHLVKVTVTDRNGNPVPNQTVNMTESGPGRFQNGPSTDPSTIQVKTGDDGTITVELFAATNESGTETVTAALPGATVNNSECKQPANQPAAGNPVGNCTAQVTINWTAQGPSNNTRPKIESPAVSAVQLGAHHHRIAGSGVPGHHVTIYRNGNPGATQVVRSGGHFAFHPWVKKRTKFYVKDIDNNKASNTVTIYVKDSVTIHCKSPHPHTLVCHLDTDPTLRHASVAYRLANQRTGSQIKRSGETNRHGNDKLVVKHLPRGHYTIRAYVYGQAGVRHGVDTAEHDVHRG